MHETRTICRDDEPCCDQTREQTRLAIKYMGKDCRLDGRRAKIVGEHLRFALIRTYDFEKPQYDVEYSWQAVNHVMSKDKQFAS